jgi:hypothetical protein
VFDLPIIRAAEVATVDIEQTTDEDFIPSLMPNIRGVSSKLEIVRKGESWAALVQVDNALTVAVVHRILKSHKEKLLTEGRDIRDRRYVDIA